MTDYKNNNTYISYHNGLLRLSSAALWYVKIFFYYYYFLGDKSSAKMMTTQKVKISTIDV